MTYRKSYNDIDGRAELAVEPFTGPHSREGMLLYGSSADDADKAVILIHGRGASPESMIPLIDELHPDAADANILYVLPAASGSQWYPQRFIAPRSANEPGLSSALDLIGATVKALEALGLGKERMYIGGFSQGACLSLDYAARNPERYGGVFALSGGLIGDSLNTLDYGIGESAAAGNHMENTPVFLGCSDVDFHIPLSRVKESSAVFEKLGAEVDERIYPGMGHTVNGDEIAALQAMILGE